MSRSTSADTFGFSPHLRLRTTLPGDAAAVVALEEAAFRETDNAYAGEKEFSRAMAVEDLLRDYIMQPDAVHLVAEADGALVGLASVAIGAGAVLPAETGQLSILVRRDWRGRGVGTRLMTALLARTTASPIIKRLSLWVRADNPRAIDLYLRFGFKVTGRVSDHDRCRLLMSRSTSGSDYAE